MAKLQMVLLEGLWRAWPPAVPYNMKTRTFAALEAKCLRTGAHDFETPDEDLKYRNIEAFEQLTSKEQQAFIDYKYTLFRLDLREGARRRKAAEDAEAPKRHWTGWERVK